MRRTKRIPIVLVLGCVVLISACSSSSKSSTPAPSTSTITSVSTTTLSPIRPGTALTHEILAVGDAVMLNASESLQRDLPGIFVDAEVTRRWADGTVLLRAYKHNGILPPSIVIGLGTNGAFSNTQFAQTMAVIGNRTVFFINVREPRPWESEVNQRLAKNVKRYKTAHLIDWRAFSNAHASWFASDGIHLTAAGAENYALLIKTSVALASRPTTTTVPTPRIAPPTTPATVPATTPPPSTPGRNPSAPLRANQATIVGVVTDADGFPVPGCTFAAVDARSTNSSVSVAKPKQSGTATDGTYQVFFSPGRYWIFVECPSGLSVYAGAPYGVSDPQAPLYVLKAHSITTLNFVLPPTGTLTVRVVSRKSGLPVRNAHIEGHLADRPFPPTGLLGDSSTAADGRFVFRTIAARTWKFFVWNPLTKYQTGTWYGGINYPSSSSAPFTVPPRAKAVTITPNSTAEITVLLN